jgi:hypothetical protein
MKHEDFDVGPGVPCGERLPVGPDSEHRGTRTRVVLSYDRDPHTRVAVMSFTAGSLGCLGTAATA